jgi:hypothetical protein
MAGDLEALAALRARNAVQAVKGNALTGKGSRKPVRSHPGQDSVTKQGTIIYCVGATSVRDAGDKLTVSRGADQNGLQEALRMAMERYGERISVNGTTIFKEQIAQAAAAAKLPVIFDDAVLEHRRQELLQATLKKESRHEQSNPANQERSAGRGAGRSGSAIAGATGAARDCRADIVVHGAGSACKPNIGRIGRYPPPESQHRLRSLSELGLVRIASGTEVLLPGHVPGHVEQQGAAADHTLRRAVPGAGRITPPLAAADKYIVEREQKRLNGFDIPKHVRYHEHDGSAAFAGMREVDGQKLVLLKKGEEVMVLPIIEATARRLKRLVVGDAVAMTPRGFIKTKGRSR